jgi:hypothetical protein
MLRRSPGWLWPLTVIGPVLLLGWWSRGGYFYADDFIFAQQARDNSFSLAYLRSGLFDHFSPVLRAEFWLMAHAFPGDLAVAQLFQLGLVTAAILAFMLTAWALFGRSWLALVLTLAFGQSLFMLRVLQWWTATANLLPATILMLLSIATYVRFVSTGRRRYLALSVLAECGALLAYEQAMLLVGYLLLLRLLIFEDRLSPLTWLRTIRHELWVWVAYLLPAVAAAVNYVALYYTPLPRPSLADLGRFLATSVGDTFLPALVGVWTQADAVESSRPLLLLADGVALSVVVLTIVRAPRAWRAWAFLAIAYAASAVPLGLSRVGRGGPGVGHELWYQQSAAFLFLLALGLAVHPRYAGRPRALLRRLPARSRVVPLCALAVALVAYEVVFARSAARLDDSSTAPKVSRAYLDNLRSGLRTLRDPVLVPDGVVPGEVVQPVFWPYNRFDKVLPFLGVRVRYDAGGLLVGPDGRLRPQPPAR